MLIAVLPFQSPAEKIKKIVSPVQGIEFRLDYANSLDMHFIQQLKRSTDLPVIFTLRKSSQGGFYTGTEEKRLLDIIKLCELNPDYIDIEWDVPIDFIKEIHAAFPEIKLICSYHDFQKTPADLSALLSSLMNPVFYAYKIATMAHSIIDALTMLYFVKTHAEKINLTGISMGEIGQCTRLLGPIMNNWMHYIAIDQDHQTAPGQLTLQDLILYPLHHYNKDTQLYALLGDPVEHSIGHEFHNQHFQAVKKNAIYIKLKVSSHELVDTISLCKQLSFSGLSITMPHKETILPLLDTIEDRDKSIQAINSVIRIDSHYIGFNTDGIAVMTVLAEWVNLSEQTIVILGAGGAARAIAYEAMQRGAQVIILNRTPKKIFNMAVYPLTELKKLSYTVLINTLPFQVDVAAWLSYEDLLPKALVMDINYGLSSFLAMAKNAGCQVIDGKKMFVEQAKLQQEKWLG